MVVEVIGRLEVGNNEDDGGSDKTVRREDDKNEGFGSSNRGNVATFGLNVATFPRAY